MDDVRMLVDKAIRAATPPEGMVERRSRPESSYTWLEPSPDAGLTAALAVMEAVQAQAHKFVLGLRGEGISWTKAAELLEIPWAEHQSRAEQAYELILGPEPERSYRERNLYWYCGSLLGCGEYITDRGPYNGSPSNNEDGHADGCRRLAAEDVAYERECEERGQRDRISEQAMNKLTDEFAKATVRRAQWVLAHGGQYKGWSHSESLAVALALDDEAGLKQQGYNTQQAAADRVFRGMNEPPANPKNWLATVRAAATGRVSGR